MKKTAGKGRPGWVVRRVHAARGVYERGKILILLGVLFMLSGLFSCRDVGSFLSTLVSEEEEIKLGQQFSSEVETQIKLYPDQSLQEYINRMGQRLVPYSDRSNISYHFKVVDEPDQINAFAIPGGWIYVYTGLLKAADNEAEVAGVLAHEIGHVAHRHGAANLGAMYGIQVAKAMVLGENPAAVAEVVSDLLSYGGILAYGREAEYQADETSVQVLSRAGYNPRGMAAFLEKLQALEGREPGTLETLLRTHPPSSKRVENVWKEIEKLGNPGGEFYEERYKRAVSRLRGS